MPRTLLNLDNLANAPIGQKVSMLRELFWLTQREFSTLLNVSDKTIARWKKGEITHHKSHRKTIDALTTIVDTLTDLFEPDVIHVWLDRPNPKLNGERPRDFAKKPGGIFIMANLLGAVGQ